jgi:hypothetical protein
MTNPFSTPLPQPKSESLFSPRHRVSSAQMDYTMFPIEQNFLETKKYINKYAKSSSRFRHLNKQFDLAGIAIGYMPDVIAIMSLNKREILPSKVAVFCLKKAVAEHKTFIRSKYGSINYSSNIGDFGDYFELDAASFNENPTVCFDRIDQIKTIVNKKIGRNTFFVNVAMSLVNKSPKEAAQKYKIPYNTVRRFIKALESWVDDDDRKLNK